MSIAHLPPDPEHQRPSGLDDETVAGVGKLTEALEWIERAKGRLFDFHQMIGHADAMIEEAADQLASAGHPGIADRLRAEIIGRNVLYGRWTFQVVEEFEDVYYGPVRAEEKLVRDELCAESVTCSKPS